MSIATVTQLWSLLCKALIVGPYTAITAQVKPARSKSCLLSTASWKEHVAAVSQNSSWLKWYQRGILPVVVTVPGAPRFVLL